MADVTLWGHAPCGYRYWTVKGDRDPVHACPAEGGRRVPLVTLRSSLLSGLNPITDGSGQVSDMATEWGQDGFADRVLSRPDVRKAIRDAGIDLDEWESAGAVGGKGWGA